MPKINVYLPDELAAAVKDAAIPVSAVCQHALEQAVRNMSAVNETTRSSGLGRLLSRHTKRLETVITLASQAAVQHGHGFLGAEHLLAGILAEGENLALRVLLSLEIDLDDLHAEVQGLLGAEGQATALTGRRKQRLSMTPKAARALKQAQKEALGLGHNYVGTEHLLLGLVAEPDGLAGSTLRAMGVELVSTRRAIVSALAGAVSGSGAVGGGGAEAGAASGAAASSSPIIDAKLDAILSRLDSLDERLRGLEP